VFGRGRRVRGRHLWVAGLLVGLCGCLPDALLSPTPGASPAPASPDPGAPPVSFRTQVAPVVARSCVECHVRDAEEPALFGQDGDVSLAAVRANIARILTEVRSGRMPRSGNTSPPRLTAQQIAQLESWRAAGMPDN